MGKIAEKYCDQIILTNEDPYDEDPMKILEDIKKASPKISRNNYRQARSHNRALKIASEPDNKNVAVLITGKGTDPYIMEANGKPLGMMLLWFAKNSKIINRT